MICKLMVNSITASRVLMTICLIYYIGTGHQGLLMISFLYAAIIISDLVDGKLARRYSACSSFGALHDVLADLFFIISISTTLVLIHVYPLWMLLIIIFKFIEFWGTSSYIRKCNRCEQNVFLFDRLGRKIAAIFYLLPYIAILSAKLLPIGWNDPFMNLICLPIAMGALISSLLRIKVCIISRNAIYNV